MKPKTKTLKNGLKTYISAVKITDHASSETKKKLLTEITKMCDKVDILTDEPSCVGHESTLIIFQKLALIAKRHLLAFHLIWLNWKFCVIPISKTT